MNGVTTISNRVTLFQGIEVDRKLADFKLVTTLPARDATPPVSPTPLMGTRLAAYVRVAG
ncbi:hypothetical protein [Sphingomonas xinjiangensis]|uniref:Uncharacterized protein n=1 Tax=Sphingomonas xinjiangensis TaxID=643568 RepID=A0A840YRD3_9SPHN|nr:hypothetical protein [Sphingomonas xinjiangensis]MBB5712181.1 hypothetical protein [Sphingomonas xinjiangensis]